MASDVNVDIRVLKDDDDLSSFSCGDADIDSFLKDDALRLQKSGGVSVYLAFHESRLVGYLAILADSIRVNSNERKKLKLLHTDHPSIPAVKVGRIGTCTDLQGKGIGKALLQFAADKALLISADVGCRLLTLDAYANRVGYYEKHGFVRNKQMAKDDAAAFRCPTECPENQGEDPGDRVSMRLDLRAEEPPTLLVSP